MKKVTPPQIGLCAKSPNHQHRVCVNANNFARAVLLAILTLGAFWPVLAAEFLVYDDPQYVTDCVFVRQGLSWSNVWWALTTFEASNWHPLMWLSLMLDRDLYGLNPIGFHATNLAWHVVNTLLLFHWLIRIAPAWPWRAFVVALLFAVHPLHVESVAWVAERKDVLFTVFGLLALHAYLSDARGSRQAFWWSAEATRERLEAAGFQWSAKNHEFLSPSGIPSQFLLAGDRAGNDSEVRFPDPGMANTVTLKEGPPVLSLARLIESKLACGAGNLRRTHKDFADVIELIDVN